MVRALAAMPPGPAMVIGADIPGITPARIAQAWRCLAGAEAVLGPAPDGGYWAIGLKRAGAAVPRRLLDGVRWSSDHAMEDTVARLAPFRIAYAETLRDVDTAADLAEISSAPHEDLPPRA